MKKKCFLCFRIIKIVTIWKNQRIMKQAFYSAFWSVMISELYRHLIVIYATIQLLLVDHPIDMYIVPKEFPRTISNAQDRNEIEKCFIDIIENCPDGFDFLRFLYITCENGMLKIRCKNGISFEIFQFFISLMIRNGMNFYIASPPALDKIAYVTVISHIIYDKTALITTLAKENTDLDLSRWEVHIEIINGKSGIIFRVDLLSAHLIDTKRGTLFYKSSEIQLEKMNRPE